MKIIQEIIASATKSLWIEIYLFDNDQIAQMLLSHQLLHYSREVGVHIANKSVVSHLLTTFNADRKDAQDRTSHIRR